VSGGGMPASSRSAAARIACSPMNVSEPGQLTVKLQLRLGEIIEIRPPAANFARHETPVPTWLPDNRE